MINNTASIMMSAMLKYLEPGGGGYLGQVLLGMCRWLLRTPYPIANPQAVDPILVTFGQMSLGFQEQNSMRADC